MDAQKSIVEQAGNALDAQDAEIGKELDAAVVDAITAPGPKESASVVRQAMLTEGELLPWKGFWWKVHLNNDTRTVELVQGKPTATTEKLTTRADRWRNQHPNESTKDGLRPGYVSGLLVRHVELRSTGLRK